jgi:hypothetical protein
MTEQDNWTPPPPPDDGSIFSAGTREYYAQEIGKKAMNSLILGIISIFCCGIIFGILGLNAANEALTNIEIYDVAHDKKGLATAGKVISIIGLVFWGVGIVIRIILAIAR